MFNTFKFNNNYYNSLGKSYGLIEDYILKYGDYSLTNKNISISGLPDIDNSPNFNFQNYSIAKANGMGNSEYTIQSKTITIRGRIRASTKAAMEEEIVNMKKYLYMKGKNFIYKRGDGRTLYTPAFLTSLVFERQTHTINYIPFTIVFTTLEPFFYQLEKAEYALTNQTTSLSGTILYDMGNYETYPVVYISINTATGVDEITLSIDGKTLTLHESLEDGDVVIIDGRKKDVSVNAITGRDYTGSFPALQVGERDFDIDINGTFNADFYIQRENTYV